MRLLLDEQTPRVLAAYLVGHEVHTSQSLGLQGLRNGELLQSGADLGFDALITLDKGIEFQQNLSALPMSVVILRSTSNRIEDLEPSVPALLATLETLEPKTLVKVGA